MIKKVVVFILFCIVSLWAMEPRQTLPTLQQLAAGTIVKGIINWDDDVASQVKKLTPQLKKVQIAHPLRDTLSTFSAPNKPHRLPLAHQICSFDHNGTIGVSVRQEPLASFITLLDLQTTRTLHSLTTHNQLDKVLISPDAKKLVLLKNLEERKVIQTFDITTKRYEALFAIARLADISFIDNTLYLQFKLRNEKYSYFTTLTELAKAHGQSASADIIDLPITALNQIKFMRPQNISKPECQHFYDTGIAVWSASLPPDNIQQFIELDTIFSSSQFVHAAVDRNGQYVVAIEPHRTISFWELKTKQRIFAQQFPHEEPTIKHVQWINDYTIMLTDDDDHLWQMDLRNFRFLELFDKELTALDQKSTTTEDPKSEA